MGFYKIIRRISDQMASCFTQNFQNMLKLECTLKINRLPWFMEMATTYCGYHNEGLYLEWKRHDVLST